MIFKLNPIISGHDILAVTAQPAAAKRCLLASSEVLKLISARLPLGLNWRRFTIHGRLCVRSVFKYIWKPIPVHKPPILFISHGYDMDITTSGIFFSKMSYPCHIHVIFFFKKDIFGYTWYILNYYAIRKSFQELLWKCKSI